MPSLPMKTQRSMVATPSQLTPPPLPRCVLRMNREARISAVPEAIRTPRPSPAMKGPIWMENSQPSMTTEQGPGGIPVLASPLHTPTPCAELKLPPASTNEQPLTVAWLAPITLMPIPEKASLPVKVHASMVGDALLNTPTPAPDR